jgi:uncharacterized protein YjbI with pentapeptide repeats
MASKRSGGTVQRSNIEQQVCKAFLTGQAVYCLSASTESNEAKHGGSWGPHRQVRAEVIAELLCGAVPVDSGQVGVVNLSGARVVGKINLPSTDIKHQLKLENCHIGDGIDLTDATTRTLSLRHCYLGQTLLSRANITGNLDLSRAYLAVKTYRAFDAALLTITGDLLCEDFRAEGGVHLRGTRVSGRVTFHGAHLNSASAGEAALNLDRVSVTGGMSCKCCCVDGGLQLRAANIEGELLFNGARLRGRVDPKGLESPALNAQGLIVSGHMDFSPMDFGPDAPPDSKRTDFLADGEVSLAFARITVIEDDPQSWPERLNLDGLVYDELRPSLEAKERLRWLGWSPKCWLRRFLDRRSPDRRSPDYRPQPYDQLAAFYYRRGDDEQARRVLLAKQRARTNQQRQRYLRWWGKLQDGLVGYGYAPIRAIAFLVGAFIVGWVIFKIYPPAPVHATGQPSFHAWLYTLDWLIPLAGLGQIGDWNPQGATVFLALGLRAFGGLLAITVIAAITRALNRS